MNRHFWTFLPLLQGFNLLQKKLSEFWSWHFLCLRRSCPISTNGQEDMQQAFSRIVINTNVMHQKAHLCELTFWIIESINIKFNNLYRSIFWKSSISQYRMTVGMNTIESQHLCLLQMKLGQRPDDHQTPFGSCLKNRFCRRFCPTAAWPSSARLRCGVSVSLKMVRFLHSVIRHSTRISSYSLIRWHSSSRYNLTICICC